MDFVQVGVAAAGEGAEQIEGAGGLEIAEFHAGGVWDAGLGGEIGAVDDVAAVAGEGFAALGFGVGGAGLGELAGHAAELYDGHGAAEGEDHRHLEEDAKRVPDDVGGEVAEGFGAVAALQDEGVALRGQRQVGFEAAGLAGENQRGEAGEAGFHGGQFRRVRVAGDLANGAVPPAGGGPA